MTGMANRAGKSVLNVPAMFDEAAVLNDLIQVVAFCAERVRAYTRAHGAGRIQVGSREEVLDGASWSPSDSGGSGNSGRDLAHLIAAFKNVRVDRSMRTAGSCAARLATIIAAVTVG